MTDDELDADVAEKVMGWRRIRTKQMTYGGYVKRQHWWREDTPDPDGDGFWTSLRADQYPKPAASESWGPSTDIAAAWKVVERMRELGWHLELNNSGSAKLDQQESWSWCAMFWTDNEDYDEPDSWPTGRDDEAPRAICLAALEAVTPAP